MHSDQTSLTGTSDPGAEDARRAALPRLGFSRPFFLRSEAVELGMSDKTLRALVRAGTIRRLRHGTYVVVADWDRLSAEQQHAMTGRAVMSRVTGAALSHVTAALAHGMDVWGIDLGLVHVTRLDGGAGRIHRLGCAEAGCVRFSRFACALPFVLACLSVVCFYLFPFFLFYYFRKN